MIRFIKTPKYMLKPRRIDVYKYLCELGMQQIDPEPTVTESLKTGGDIVFYSTLNRVTNGLKKSTGQSFVAMRELKEVLFDLEEFCDQDKWQKDGSAAVRRGFKDAFKKNKLPQKRDVILDEVAYVINRCLECKQDEIAVISHSFRLKLIESYIETGGKLRTRPELLDQYIHDDQKTFDFGKGFVYTKEEISRALYNENK